MQRFLILLVLLLTSCLSAEDRRFSREYDTDRLGAWTKKHGVWVIFPEWMDAGRYNLDRAKTLWMLDSYIDVVEEEYPWARRVNWEAVTVFIHNSLDRCVSGPPPTWCRGWRSGSYMFVCWRTEVQDGKRVLARQNCLPALPHELFHYILLLQYGNPDTNHDMLFPLPVVRDTIQAAQDRSVNILLTERVRGNALAYRYQPWTIPGYRE